MTQDPDMGVWDGMLSHLRTQHPAICRQWFEELEPLGISGGAFNLRTLSAIHRDYLRQRCADAFNDAARSVSGRLLSVRFLGPEDDVARAPRHPRPSAGREDRDDDRPSIPFSPGIERPPASPAAGRDDASPPRAGDSRAIVETGPAHQDPAGGRPGESRPSRADSLVINPDYSFETFVVGPTNRLAHAAAKAVAAAPGRAYNPFFIHGGVGLGKTHLLQAVCLEAAVNNSRLNLYYISCESFVTQFMESVRSGEMTDFRHRFRDVDILVIDDIHFLAKRDRTQEEFFHTFNILYHSGKQIILSSDAAPEEIPDLEARLVSRFKWGLVTKLEPPCYETRVAILQTKARLRHITISQDVAEFIAARVESNIRELEGAIVKLQIQSSVENRAIDLDLARAALGDSPSPASPGEPTIQVILAIVTDFYGVKITEVQSKRRHRSVALPRQVCMFLARRLTRMSLEEIGGYFGGRDHTTVMHAIRTIEARRGNDGEFDLVVKSLEDKVRPAR
jgi:chromosomal replication initiator protein